MSQNVDACQYNWFICWLVITFSQMWHFKDIPKSKWVSRQIRFVHLHKSTEHEIPLTLLGWRPQRPGACSARLRPLLSTDRRSVPTTIPRDASRCDWLSDYRWHWESHLNLTSVRNNKSDILQDVCLMAV